MHENKNSEKSNSSQNSQKDKTQTEIAKKSRKIRDDLSEKKIDKMIKDSFPASDPPSTY